MHRQGSNDSAGGLGAFGARNGQTVAPLVLRMSIVPAHPDDLHAMDFQQVQEDLPEVGVQGGGFVCFPPAILPPLDRPTLFDRVADILTAIRNQGTIMTIKTGGPDESKWTSSPRSAYN